MTVGFRSIKIFRNAALFEGIKVLNLEKIA